MAPFAGAILTAGDEGGKAALSEPAARPRRSGRQEVPMLKALLTPVILGLAVALLIRLATPRRAY